jgi:hypothetical protein
MSRNDTQETVSVVSFTSSCLGYINGIKLSKFGLLINRTSSIYPNESEIKGFSFCHCFVFDKFLYKLNLIVVYEKISKKRGTFLNVNMIYINGEDCCLTCVLYFCLFDQ